jgi:uncharacterized MAPEG superfamily protein
MTLAFWCILVAGLLPYVATGIAKFGGPGKYDNREPRAWLEQQTGLAHRADSAQKNGFEALPLFAAAVLVATWQHAPPGKIDGLAVTFVVARVGYLVCYLADWPLARSVVWTLGLGACVGLFVLAA